MNSDTVAMPSRTRRDILRGAAAVLAFSPLSESVASTDPAEVFALGVASGYPRPDSVVLWTRISAPSGALPRLVHWELAADEGFQRIVARGTELAHADDAFSVHAEPSGLDPARTYWYRFEVLGVRSPVGRTRTAPAPTSSVTLRLAIASCQRFDTGHYAATNFAFVSNCPWQPTGVRRCQKGSASVLRVAANYSRSLRADARCDVLPRRESSSKSVISDRR